MVTNTAKGWIYVVDTSQLLKLFKKCQTLYIEYIIIYSRITN